MNVFGHWASALFATLPQTHANIGLLALRSANLLSLPSHPIVANSALDFALSSLRLGDSVFFQTDGIVCMQGKQKIPTKMRGFILILSISFSNYLSNDSNSSSLISKSIPFLLDFFFLRSLFLHILFGPRLRVFTK